MTGFGLVSLLCQEHHVMAD